MNKEVKICIFSSTHSWDDHRIFHKQVLSLSRNGFKVVLIACESKSKFLFSDTNICISILPNGNRFYRFTIHQIVLLYKVLKSKAQIFHFHDPDLIFVGLILRLFGKKVIYDVHEDYPQSILCKYWIHKHLRVAISRIFEWIENFCSKRYIAIVAATPYIKKRFVSAGCANVVDICNYPDLSLYNFDLKSYDFFEKPLTICYTGGITQEKGVVEIIQSVEDNSIKLFLAGNISPSTLKFELESMPGWKNTEYFGYLNVTDIKNIYNKSQVGIVMFHPTGNYINALPVKMFEYMAAGIPVIASDFDLWKEIIVGNNCGICISPGDAELLKNAINSFIKEPQKIKIMGENGRNAILNKYNWAIESKKLIFLYNRLLNNTN